MKKAPCGHSQPRFNEKQLANLRTLAEKLKTLTEDNCKYFSMRQFSPQHMEPAHTIHNCNSVGCAIGHGPRLGIEPLPHEDWHEYGGRCFGAHNDDVWDWCFSADWSDTDNTPQGAAARIEYMLEHSVPYTAREQKLGERKLCYSV
jgi:hypothetical protein